jgi:hypothetical protein
MGEVFDGPVQIVFGFLGQAPAVVAIRIFGVPFDSPGEIRDCSIKVPFVGFRVAAVPLGGWKAGIDFKGVGGIGNSPFQIPFRLLIGASIEVGTGVLWI